MKFITGFLSIYIFLSFISISYSVTLEDYDGGTYNGEVKKPCVLFCKKIPHGNGTWVKGNQKYIGEWIDGKKNGSGTFFKPRNHIQKFRGVFYVDYPSSASGHILFDNEDSYIGNVNKAYHPHGSGIKNYKNGDLFEGEFLYGDIKNGKMKYANGSIYEGSFINSKPDLNNGRWIKKNNNKNSSPIIPNKKPRWPYSYEFYDLVAHSLIGIIVFLFIIILIRSVINKFPMLKDFFLNKGEGNRYQNFKEDTLASALKAKSPVNREKASMDRNAETIKSSITMNAMRFSSISFIVREKAIFLQIHNTNILKILLITSIGYFIFSQLIQLIFYDFAYYGPPIILGHLIDTAIVTLIVWLIIFIVRRIKFNEEINYTFYSTDSRILVNRNKILIIVSPILIIGLSFFIFNSNDNERTAYCDYKFNGFSGSTNKCNNMLDHFHDDKLRLFEDYYLKQKGSTAKLSDYVCKDFHAKSFELYEIKSCIRSLEDNLDIANKNERIRKQNDEIDRQYSGSGSSNKPTFGQMLGGILGILGGIDSIKNPQSYSTPTTQLCYRTGEYTKGMNKVCQYSCTGSAHAITVKSVEMCPLTVKR